MKTPNTHVSSSSPLSIWERAGVRVPTCGTAGSLVSSLPFLRALDRSSRPARLAALLLALAALGLLSDRLLAADKPDRSDSRYFRDHYSVISERSIFSRNRSSGRRDMPTMAYAGRTEQRHTLVGLVTLEEYEAERGPFAAYVEDGRSGQVVRVRVGDSIAQGKIARIDETSIDYEAAGHTRRIEIGMSIVLEEHAARADGGAGPTSQPTIVVGQPDGSGNSGAAATPPGGSGGAEDDIIARLKARRAAELKGKQ